MMKRIVSLLMIACGVPVVCAGYSDGLIGPGEYEGGVEWDSGLLVVDGGGAYRIEVLSPARLEVRSTSLPDKNWFNGGIQDIVLYGKAHLDYYGGLTQELTVRGSAISNLYGGRIDYITSRQFVNWIDGQPQGQHINIYCNPGWSWTYENNVIRGIIGQWRDGSALNIRFLNDPDYDPVWSNVNVIIPEPATMLLLSLGGLMLRCKR